MRNHTIVILSNVSSGLISFRKELLSRLCDEYRVVVIAEDTGGVDEIVDLGCEYIDISINRHGMNPIEDLKLEKRYKNLLCELMPFVVLTYTIKPNIYGGLACTTLGIPYISNITGLGDAIENTGVVSVIAKAMYKRGLNNAHKVFFQNHSNCDFFLRNKLYKGDYSVLPGSGVNLKTHQYEPYPECNENKIIKIVVVGRITKDKGIQEVLEAAHRLQNDIITITLIGNCEGNYMKQIEEASEVGAIQYVGTQNNIHEWYKNSHAILHASYHEGMSNVLLEAAACGRPIIATNIPGCREAFDEGISGIAFEPKNVESLIEAVEKFISLPYEEKAQMGLAGRKKMESSFDRSIVVDRYITAIKEIEGKK